jgi:UDP-N-acetylmuramoylalanine--D-glutamate ligase
MSRLDDWQAAGGEVAVAGLGRSGMAAARLLRHHDIGVYISDLSSGREEAAATLRSEWPTGLDAQAGAHDHARVARAVALVVSPGIPPDADVLRTARAAGVPVVAEAQLGLDALGRVPWVAVTGTNGKTTTTALVEHLLRRGGRRAVAAGNIGTPLTAVALGPAPPEWLAVELSSFQLHDMTALHPTVGVLTNLAPDHLDRYVDLEDYYADKARLFAAAGAESIWVSNLDDVDSRPMVAEVPGRHLAFSVRRRADAWLDRDRGALMLGDAPLVPRDALPLLGDHNVANALAAALAVHATGVAREALAAGLADFRALPHRMEPVGEVAGVRFVNDSKATNVASTVVALEAMTQPFVLLLGGRHKGEAYTALRRRLREAAVAVVAYGEAGDLIAADLGEAVRVVRGTTFEDAVTRAVALAPAGGTVLLSPACSSYDMFDNYEQRGDAFRALVHAL